MELSQIKLQWNEVLDLLLEKDRIAWLAFLSLQTLMILRKVVIHPTLNY